MAEVLEAFEQSPLVLHTAPDWRMNDDQFFRFCQANKDLRIERSAEGDLVIMSPEAGSSGSGSARLTRRFDEWAESEGRGTIFSSSTGFILPNNAIRSPDVSWVLNERLAGLTDAQWHKYLPLCPDFVLELRSPTDRLADLREKMEEYIQNGARLGWLMDPTLRQVHVYAPNQTPQILSDPQTLSGRSVLAGFILDLTEIWAAINRRRR